MLLPTTRSPHRLSQDALGSPPQTASTVNDVHRDAGYSAPLIKCSRYASKSHSSNTSSVIGLLFWVAPSAIIRFVISVIINAIYRAFVFRSFTHIPEKVFKTSAPPFRNFYPSPPIQGKFFTSRVVASVVNVQPRFVFNRVAHAVSGGDLHCDFPLQAAAGFRSSSYEAAGVNNTICPAIAAGMPTNNACFTPGGLRYNYKTAKTLACDILQFRHWLTLSKLMFRWPGASNTRFTDHDSMWAA